MKRGAFGLLVLAIVCAALTGVLIAGAVRFLTVVPSRAGVPALAVRKPPHEPNPLTGQLASAVTALERSEARLEWALGELARRAMPPPPHEAFRRLDPPPAASRHPARATPVRPRQPSWSAHVSPEVETLK